MISFRPNVVSFSETNSKNFAESFMFMMLVLGEFWSSLLRVSDMRASIYAANEISNDLWLFLFNSVPVSENIWSDLNNLVNV